MFIHIIKKTGTAFAGGTNFKRQSHKMVKHVQTIRWPFADVYHCIYRPAGH